MFSGSSLSALPQLAIVLGIMVLVHEFGHFAAAKLCGVRVEAFAIGFGKRLIGFVHNGTDYRLNLLPLGGYVRMAGVGDEPISGSEQQASTLDPGELQNHPRWQRTIIALAGPVANFLLAFFLMFGLFLTHNEIPEYFSQPVTADYISPTSRVAQTGMVFGDRLVRFDTVENPTWEDVEQRASTVDLNKQTAFSFTHNGQRVDKQIFVESKGKPEDFTFESLGLVPVMQDRPVQVSEIADAKVPAARAGLKSGDKIVAIDGIHPHSVPALLAYLQDQAGKPAMLTVERQGAQQPLSLSITPALMDTQEGKSYKLGFTPVLPPVVVKHMPVAEAAGKSEEFCIKNSRLIFDVLHRLFTREVSVKSLSSPIGIGVQVHQAFEAQGWLPIIGTMALISLNLGIFNLLPIPILDGGMIAFLAIESLMRRDLNQQLKERIYQVAFVCILLFAAVVIFNDITKFLPIHGKP